MESREASHENNPAVSPEEPQNVENVENAGAGSQHAGAGSQEASGETSGALDTLARELDEARSKAESAYAELLRARAEIDNIRKRAARDVESAHKFALERFVGELLPIKDSMELGAAAAAQATDIESLREGIALTLKMYASALERHGVGEVNPVGEKFNPELHEAMSVEEAEGSESGTVIRVLQKGYTLNGRLVRPALVVVAK